MSAENSLVQFFSSDHAHCDSLWAQVESACLAGKAEGVAQALAVFDAELRRHLRWEEESLFPQLEAAHEGAKGPTSVMKVEHDRMRGMLDILKRVAQKANYETLLDQGDTLLLLTRQHNQKEENILYPLAERALADGGASLIAQLQSEA